MFLLCNIIIILFIKWRYNKLITNNNYIHIITYMSKIFFMTLYTYYTFLKITNTNTISKFKLFILVINNLLLAFLFTFIRYKFDGFASIIFLIFSSSILYSIITNNKIGYSILITTISLSINYFLFFIATVLYFFINLFFKIQNNYINLSIMLLIHLSILYIIFKFKRFKHGFSFLNKNFSNEHFDILILNVSVIILFSFIFLKNSDYFLSTNLVFGLIIFAIIMFITIKKSFTMYYKHKLLVTELNDTKKELEEKKKEIADLESENLEFSKTSHSIAHKQKSLEHKINKLLLQNEITEELDLRDRLNDISKECFESIASAPIPKTEIEIIDDMISCMSAECKNSNIDFELQLNGNIHHMVNNYITKEELEILLADHIKDAIIAINHSNNINKSILVKLGLFNGEYLLSIYDSGIEFEIDTLLDLGIKPSTTHKEDGGTGMGFMNTFDTLNKNNASLYINEFNAPNKENYTKSVTISFNNKNEYKISSYRANEIKVKNNRNNLIIE